MGLHRGVLLAILAGEEDTEQNLWVFEEEERQLKGQMGQLFLVGTVWESFLLADFSCMVWQDPLWKSCWLCGS